MQQHLSSHMLFDNVTLSFAHQEVQSNHFPLKYGQANGCLGQQGVLQLTLCDPLDGSWKAMHLPLVNWNTGADSTKSDDPEAIIWGLEFSGFW